MIEEQRAKYQFILDDLTDEQKAVLNFATGILEQSTSCRRFTIKGQTYFTLLWNGNIGGEPREMRLTVGLKGWTFCPVEMSLKECLPG